MAFFLDISNFPLFSVFHIYGSLPNLYPPYILLLQILLFLSKKKKKKNTFILFFYFLYVLLFSNHKPTNRMLLPSLYNAFPFLSTHPSLFLSVIFPSSISSRKSDSQNPRENQNLRTKEKSSIEEDVPSFLLRFLSATPSRPVIYPSVSSLSCASNPTILIFVAFR